MGLLTTDGTLLLVNAGTDPVEGSREEHATQNIAQLVQDTGLTGIIVRRDAPKDYGEGRFAYELGYHGRKIEVQMPGLPLEQVRFLGEKGQSILPFPRLYVNGSSWQWKFAADIIKDRCEGQS